MTVRGRYCYWYISIDISFTKFFDDDDVVFYSMTGLTAEKFDGILTDSTLTMGQCFFNDVGH